MRRCAHATRMLARGSGSERVRKCICSPQAHHHADDRAADSARGLRTGSTSSIYWGVHPQPIELAATISIRNVSSRYPLVLESVRYYDSAGKQVREYVSTPSELGSLATVEFVKSTKRHRWGPRGRKLQRWTGSPRMNEPLIEAVMVGQNGNAGISFTSSGRPVKDEAER